MNNKKNSAIFNRRAVALVLLYGALPLFILNTNPERMPLPLLLVPFMLFFGVLFVTIYLIGSRTRILRGMARRKQYSVAGLLAAIPLLLLVFQSLHQLTIRDAIIAVSLVVATSFYMGRADFLR